MKKEQTKNSLALALIFVLIFSILGVWAIFRLTRLEKERDLANWQLTLGVMADSRAGAVNGWLDRQFAILQELAGNGSLQFYIQQITVPPEPDQQAEPAQITYLRNLVRATAERHGFLDREQSQPQIKANLAFIADNSLTLFAGDHNIIATTPGVTKPDSGLKARLDEVLQSAKPIIADLHLNENNRPVMGFMVPVFALQNSNNGGQRPIGVIYGVKEAGKHLFPLLQPAGNTMAGAETLLIKREGAQLIYLSPLADKTPALKKTLSANAENLAAALALRSPGFFGEALDYSGTSVLFTSRRISGTTWLLMEKINGNEALAESGRHQKFLMTSLLLSLLLTVSFVTAAWWHGKSVRERRALAELEDKSRELQAQTNLLNAVNDNITDFILLIDHNQHLIFTNRTFASRLAAKPEELTGKNLTGIMGPQSAQIIQELCRKTMERQKVSTLELELELQGRMLIFSAALIPVRLHDDNGQSILVTLHDITQLQAERQNKQRLTEQIIKALMRAIDLHDPYSAGHSAKTAEVAGAVGRAMNLDEETLATITTAANLCNLGKLSIPDDLLTKTESLTAEEQEIIRGEGLSAREILKGIDFSGPVLETIAQKHEFLDGSGYPAGLKGEEIILPARVLAAANSFVAMVSPRAYRKKLTIQETMEELLRNSGSKYDRKVIAALFHVMENVLDWPEIKE